MIMPIDIDKKEFTRDKRGYNSREVDEFLDLIVVDYEKVLNDNRSMAHKIKSLEKQLADSQQSDTAMVETLQTAKKLMSDISASAERRAELMIRDAELEAENILSDAKVSVKKLNEEHQMVSGKVDRLRRNLKRLLEAELEDLEKDKYNLLVDMKVQEEIKEEKKEEPAPAKTLVITSEKEKTDIESIFDEKEEESANEPEDKSTKEIEIPPISDLEHATLSDLSDSLKKFANEPDAMNDTIILK